MWKRLVALRPVQARPEAQLALWSGSITNGRSKMLSGSNGSSGDLLLDRFWCGVRTRAKGGTVQKGYKIGAFAKSQVVTSPSHLTKAGQRAVDGASESFFAKGQRVRVRPDCADLRPGANAGERGRATPRWVGRNRLFGLQNRSSPLRTTARA